MTKGVLPIAYTAGGLFARGVSSAVNRSVRLAPFDNGSRFSVASADSKATVSTAYHVAQQPNQSLHGLQVCVWVDSKTADGRSRSGPFCFDEEERKLNLEGVDVGSHRLSAAVMVPAREPGTTSRRLTPIATQDFEVVARLPGEFVPTYEWQDVMPEQAVPSGLEIQMPLDGKGRKCARIPPEWQLQLWVEWAAQGSGSSSRGVKGFFMRMFLGQESTVRDIRQGIARHPRFGRPESSVELLLDGEVLSDGATVASLDLFNRKEGLAVAVDTSL